MKKFKNIPTLNSYLNDTYGVMWYNLDHLENVLLNGGLTYIDCGLRLYPQGDIQNDYYFTIEDHYKKSHLNIRLS